MAGLAPVDLPAPVEAFLAGKNAPAEFRTFLAACNISTVKEIAKLAVEEAGLRSEVFALLDLNALNPDGTMQPAAPIADRQHAVQVMSRIRVILEAAKSLSSSVSIQELEAMPDLPVAAHTLEYLTDLFFGNATEMGYGFKFATSERGHDRLVEILRNHAAHGFLRTIELDKVYRANETPRLILVMKKEKLDGTVVSDHKVFDDRLNTLMNTYALVGIQRNAHGVMFCNYQATRDYLTFVKERSEANPHMTAAQRKTADFKTRAMWTESVNTEHMTLTAAIYDSIPAKALAHWTVPVLTTESRPAPPSKKQKRDEKQPPSARQTLITNAYNALPPHAVKSKWETKRNGQFLCRNYQLGLCQLNPCPFLEECALPGCAGQKHPAKDCPNK